MKMLESHLKRVTELSWEAEGAMWVCEGDMFAGSGVGREKKEGGFRDACNRFFNWCGRVIQKGNRTYFRVDRNEENIIRVPVTVFVLLTILFFWILFWVLVAGLFLGCRYSFEGVDEVTVDVNKAMDRAAEAAQSIKKEFTEKE